MNSSLVTVSYSVLIPVGLLLLSDGKLRGYFKRVSSSSTDGLNVRLVGVRLVLGDHFDDTEVYRKQLSRCESHQADVCIIAIA